MTANADVEIGTDQSRAGAAESEPAARARRISAKILVILTCAGALLAAILVVFLRSAKGEATAPPPADVPRAEGNKVIFSERFAERIGIKTLEVKRAPLTPVVSVVGTVTFDPQYVAAVGTRLRGIVRGVKKFEGDTVKKGEILAEIDSPELAEAQASVVTLQAQVNAAKVNAEREKELVSKNLSTAREAELADVNLEKYSAMLNAAQQKVSALGGRVATRALGILSMRSPLDGTVVERHVSTGQSVQSELVAYRVANLDHLWVELSVFEHHLSSIRLDDRVELHPLSNPEEKIDGRVAHIGAQISADTRSADVRIEIDNRKRRLRPGQAVTANIHASGAARNDVLLVPAKAVTFVDGKATVFVAENQTAVRAVEVDLGSTDGQERQVLRGLNAGDRIVSEGVFALKSELFR